MLFYDLFKHGMNFPHTYQRNATKSICYRLQLLWAVWQMQLYKFIQTKNISAKKLKQPFFSSF